VHFFDVVEAQAHLTLLEAAALLLQVEELQVATCRFRVLLLGQHFSKRKFSLGVHGTFVPAALLRRLGVDFLENEQAFLEVFAADV
jgi:hypothetical protein